MFQGVDIGLGDLKPFYVITVRVKMSIWRYVITSLPSSGIFGI